MSLLQSLEDDRVKRLKSLRYDSDVLIVKDINKNPSPKGLSNQIVKRADDVVRLTKLFTKRNGIKYLANEALLRQTSNINKLTSIAQEKGLKGLKGELASKVTNEKTGKFDIGKVGKALLNSVTTTAKLIGSTLAQAAVNGTGTHFIQRFGGKGDSTYLLNEELNTPIAQRNLNIAQGFIPVSKRQILSEESFESEGEKIIEFDTIDKSKQFDNSNRYSDSDPLNINDAINKYNEELTSDDFTKTEIDNKEAENVNKTILSYQSQIQRDVRTKSGNISGRSNNERVKSYEIKSPNGKTSIISLPDTLKPDNINVNSKESKNKLDVIDTFNEGDKKSKEVNDFIKFHFYSHEVDRNRWLFFNAYLEALDDNFNANWSPVQYVGRGEKFYVFGDYERTVNFTFAVSANTRDELIPIYRKLNYFASITAPNYSTNSLFMRGSLINVTIGDYLVRKKAILNTVNITWDRSAPWETLTYGDGKEIGYNFKGEKYKMLQLPHTLKVTATITPIEDFVPATGTPGFIGPQNMGKIIKDDSQQPSPRPASSASPRIFSNESGRRLEI
tara:strand:- start:527 stop:2203 length:1677 start_codon:yes stop_codon:yes gene_type:complete